MSDIALLTPLPDAAQASVEALVGCVAGAVLVDDTRTMVHEAGLVEATFETRTDAIHQMGEWLDPCFRELANHFPAGTRPSDFVTSLNITAYKPE